MQAAVEHGQRTRSLRLVPGVTRGRNVSPLSVKRRGFYYRFPATPVFLLLPALCVDDPTFEEYREQLPLLSSHARSMAGIIEFAHGAHGSCQSIFRTSLARQAHLSAAQARDTTVSRPSPRWCLQSSKSPCWLTPQIDPSLPDLLTSLHWQGEISFSKNGRDLGVAFKLPAGAKGPFFPAVALKSAQVGGFVFP